MKKIKIVIEAGDTSGNTVRFEAPNARFSNRVIIDEYGTLYQTIDFPLMETNALPGDWGGEGDDSEDAEDEE